MNEQFQAKYKRVLDILPDVAECAQMKLVLVGGTALALFHMKHRISVDLDFVPLEGKDTEWKEKLKGCITKKGYKTQRAAFQNQFVILFEDTGIKIEVFEPDYKIKEIEEHDVGSSKIQVASLDDILELKLASYSERLAARDLFDIVYILKEKGAGFTAVEKLVQKYGAPKDIDELDGMVPDKKDIEFFKKVIENASKTSD